MKKRYIALIVLAVLVALVIAALKIAPSFAKDYVVEHSEELIGRKMKIAAIDFNPLTFTVSVDDFAIFEQDGATPFVAFEKFRINVNPTRLISKDISVSEIYLKGLYTQVVQDGDRFNFSDILDKFAAADTASVDSAAVADSSKSDSTVAVADSAANDSAKALNLDPVELTGGFSVSVENIVLEKGNIIYQDRKVGSKFHLQDFSVEIPAVYFNGKDTDIGVNLKFADGGDLSVKVLFNMQSQDFNVAVGLKQFALACGKPYLKDFINYKDFSGFLDVNLNVAGNVNDVLSSNVNGTVGLNDIVLTETSDKTIGVNSVQVGIQKANLNEMDFVVDSVVVDGAFAHLDLFKGGKTNIDVLLNPKGNVEVDSAATASDSALAAATVTAAPVDSSKAAADSIAAAETTKEAVPAKPLKFVLNKLQVKNTSVSANDFTIKKPFSYKVSGISVNGSNINLNTPCAVTVGANFPEGGTLSVKYKGSLSDLSTMDAYISVKNLALKHFSPYSYHFTGYPIISGTMAFASDNKINKFNLDSKNTIDIYNIDVGDKDPDSDPEFTVPMKVGLYILKDKDDKIQFDIPVQGNMQDPEFSYIKIVWKTVMNLLIKVALSPLKIVGNVASSGAGAIGLDLGSNDEIIIDPLNNDMESEQYAKASKMVSAVAKDPKLKMNFVQSFNMKKTVDAYKTRKLKTEFYKATQGKTTLNELDEKAIIAIEDKDEAYAAYAAENGSKLDRKTLEKELLDLAAKRNANLLKTLQQQAGVTKKNVTVTTAPRSQLVNHKGKANYKVQIDVQ